MIKSSKLRILLDASKYFCRLEHSLSRCIEIFHKLTISAGYLPLTSQHIGDIEIIQMIIR